MRPSATVSRRHLLLGAGSVGALGVVGAVVGTASAAQPTVTTAAAVPKPFAHPGLLHTTADFDRIKDKIKASDPLVTSGWQRLTANGRARASWSPRPLKTVVRGGVGQNYAQLYPDVHAAYQNALRWRISGDTAHADTAANILNAWSSTLTQVTGNADRFLAAGLYGYQLANAAELLRGYSGFDLAGLQDLLKNVFYPLNDQFLTHHNGASITNYWANWDLCSVASTMAIGILCDDRSLFDRAVTYMHSGPGNGSIPHAIPFIHGNLGQWQESGRDQGHTVMGVGLMGTICEMAWNQKVDLYGHDDNRFLKGAEYVAKYNLGQDVPFTTYQWGTGVSGALRTQPVISSASRGQIRPVWELVLNHYTQRRGLKAPHVAAMAQKVRAEGGGGDYGPASGGFDQLGFGTLMFTRDKSTDIPGAAAPIPTATPGKPRRRRPRWRARPTASPS
ncbi:membrane protein [Kineosporia sp. NBRC 101677]|uniref:alginate lyase family protein n=1 Tax=Kineosporia sp. NBRC 101677 TaxID=3032197 RepID=UPI0024A0BDD2|nr:alginate lyase family protein [Kineosporia sp. NBRC 101677]GLY16718.1 membrane protein [Kineosporia sp. NBRC 101677]